MLRSVEHSHLLSDDNTPPRNEDRGERPIQPFCQPRRSGDVNAYLIMGSVFDLRKWTHHSSVSIRSPSSSFIRAFPSHCDFTNATTASGSIPAMGAYRGVSLLHLVCVVVLWSCGSGLYIPRSCKSHIEEVLL